MVHYNDALDRLVQVDEVVRLNDDGTTCTDLRTWETQYDYDLLGNLVHIKDSQQNEKWFRFDAAERKLYLNDPDRGAMQYKYDHADNLSETIDAKMQRITYHYDGNNRLLTEDYHDQGSSFTFNRSPDVAVSYDMPQGEVDLGDSTTATAANTKGYLSWINDTSGEEHNSFDSRGRVQWVVKRLPDTKTSLLRSYKTGQTFDAMDRLVRLVYADNDEVMHGYNSRSLLETISGGATANVHNNPFIPRKPRVPTLRAVAADWIRK